MNFITRGYYIDNTFQSYIKMSILVNPTIKLQLSEELKNFLIKFLSNQDNATLASGGFDIMSHIEVTPIFMKYCKYNNLNDPSNNRLIVVNDELSQLFNLEIGTRITYSQAGGNLFRHYTQIK